MSLPDKCLVDTNVPKTANLALESASIPPELETCISACIEAIEHVTTKRGLVIDAGDEIFAEQLSSDEEEFPYEGISATELQSDQSGFA